MMEIGPSSFCSTVSTLPTRKELSPTGSPSLISRLLCDSKLPLSRTLREVPTMCQCLAVMERPAVSSGAHSPAAALPSAAPTDAHLERRTPFPWTFYLKVPMQSSINTPPPPIKISVHFLQKKTLSYLITLQASKSGNERDALLPSNPETPPESHEVSQW